MSEEVQALTKLIQSQMAAAADIEAKLSDMLTMTLSSLSQLQSHQSNVSGLTSTLSTKTVSAERPLLLSSSTLAYFTAWNEAWEDYAICQQLSSQPRETRVSALRQSLDEDLRRFIREGIIALTPHPNISDIITAVQKYLRRQRNPLLDRINFYGKKQQHGESFDAFYTSLHEMLNQCDFHDMSVCSNCTGRMCSACPSALRKVNETCSGIEL